MINIPYYSTNLSDFGNADDIANHTIENRLWDYDFNGKAEFKIAYTDEALLIKFEVTEENILAIYNQPNDPVYKDSCVEFFIALDNEEEYYNFEFNCKGTCRAGFGKEREERALLTSKTIKTIKTNSSFKSVNFEEKKMIKWELSLEIPKEVFQFHQIQSFKNKKAKINFYKCGDDLPQPHFLSWKPIQSQTPNFHLPEFFGNAIFE